MTHNTTLKIVCCVLLCGLLSGLYGCASSSKTSGDNHESKRDENLSHTVELSDDELDARLQKIAVETLGEREGSIVMMDAQTNRVRAVVNPRLASEHAFPPGSIIKPFTLLAALRSGTISINDAATCRSPFSNRDFTILCSHPKTDAPLNLQTSLAYSCNSRFARISERTSESAWVTTLKTFGFGERTDANFGGESKGKFGVGTWTIAAGLGESEYLLATPLQILRAYAALVNGGRVMRLQQARAADFNPQQISKIHINEEHRLLLIKAMRDVVTYGTAREANLDKLPLRIFGKTGTSTASNNFRTQGWFVGFASNKRHADEDVFFNNDVPAPEDVALVVLVFLRRAHGAEAAELSRPIFEAFANSNASFDADGHQINFTANDGRLESLNQNVKVNLIESERENGRKKIVSLSIDDYVAGVLAAEASVEMEREALKAQAIASRTFALVNRGRHASAGFDFCATTHCQRFTSILTRSGSSASRNINRPREMVFATRKQVLIDAKGKLVDAYFHAACGGATANIEPVWGVAPSPIYLQGVADETCAPDKSQAWTTKINRRRLAGSLAVDGRMNVGKSIEEIVIARRDKTNRAEMIEVQGDERNKVVRGWDFKIAVGRALGWHELKSTRFDVRRSDEDFIFEGRGFGHGLGLCQIGAHVRAEVGATAAEILAHYFPRTRILNLNLNLNGNSPSSNFIEHTRQKLSSDNFRIAFANRDERRLAENSLAALEAAYKDLSQRLLAAGGRLVDKDKIEVEVYQSTGDFTAQTGHGAWAGATTVNRKIYLQPLAVLHRRGILTRTLRHELTHVFINQIKPQTARWLAEGAAIHFAGEAENYRGMTTQEATREMTLIELENRLQRPTRNLAEMRSLYAAAYRATRKILASGEASLWREIVGK